MRVRGGVGQPQRAGDAMTDAEIAHIQERYSLGQITGADMGALLEERLGLVTSIRLQDKVIRAMGEEVERLKLVESGAADDRAEYARLGCLAIDRDAEVARLRAEVARLRATKSALVRAHDLQECGSPCGGCAGCEAWRAALVSEMEPDL